MVVYTVHQPALGERPTGLRKLGRHDAVTVSTVGRAYRHPGDDACRITATPGPLGASSGRRPSSPPPAGCGVPGDPVLRGRPR